MEIIPWIIAGSWLVFILYWAISAFGVKRDLGGTSWILSWWLRVIVIVALVGLVFDASGFGQIMSHSYLMYLFNAQITVLAPIGALLCVLGIALAIWARVHLGTNWSPAPSLKEGHELVTSGPYALVRHPIYTGVILAVLGSTIASPTWILMFFIVSGMFIWRVHVEENLMMQQFPDQYPAYKKRTWALVPYVW